MSSSGSSRRNSISTTTTLNIEDRRTRLRRASLINNSRSRLNVSHLINNQTNNSELVGSDEIGVKVPIVGYEVVEHRDRFTIFKLRVENERLNDNWLVFRRYTDFERLLAELKDLVPSIELSLPPKRYLKSNFEDSFLSERMKGLQVFVDSLLITHKLHKIPIVRRFFCLDEPPPFPQNAEESRAVFGSLEESLVQMRENLETKENENEILKAEIALLRKKNENLLRLTRTCKSCSSRRSSQLFSPIQNSGPLAISTPNMDYLTPLSSKIQNKSQSSSLNKNNNAQKVLYSENNNEVDENNDKNEERRKIGGVNNNESVVLNDGSTSTTNGDSYDVISSPE